MSGTLSHRSEGFSSRMFIQPCISTFSTFQNYLFHIFYVCFFKGPGEKSFWKGSLNHHFIQSCISTFSTFQEYLVNGFYVCFFKGPGEKLFKRVLFKNILLTAYNFFFNFSIIFG